MKEYENKNISNIPSSIVNLYKTHSSPNININTNIQQT